MIANGAKKAEELFTAAKNVVFQFAILREIFAEDIAEQMVDFGKYR